ncbi:MAG TPA: hypothetical protein PLL42_01880 [Bacilli bacterium]|nr:hypothetical protein [Bacilli bacterium]
MKLEKNIISFEVDDKTIKAFELATSILEKDPDEAFKEWVQRLSYLAMQQSLGSNSERQNLMFSSSRTPERSMLLKIARWVVQPRTMAFNMMKSYFIILDKNANHEVKRDEMMHAYLNLEFDNEQRKNEDSFIRNFRMMCSSSAYGDIFAFDSATQLVTLNPKIASDVLKYKDAFLP